MANTPYPQSYYAASANPVPPRPALQGEVETDVCIIGAGYTGLSSALFLLENGFKVSIVEAAKVGFGASGRNGGQIVNSYSRDIDVIERTVGPKQAQLLGHMAFEGGRIIRERVAKYNIQCDLKDGGVFAAITSKQMGHLESQKRLWERFGHNQLELMDQKRIREVVACDSYVGGMLDMSGGHIHPLNLALGEAAAVESLGGIIYEQTPAVRIERGANPVVHTPQGKVRAKFIIVAGNAYLGNLVPELAAKSMPCGTQVITTEPLGEELARTLLPQDYCVEDCNYLLAYYRLTADKRLLFGGGANYSGRDSRDIEGELRPCIERTFPALKGVPIEFQWSCAMGIVVNRIPQLGKLSDNVWYCQGYSGHGIATSHIMGEIMAEALTGTLEKFDTFAQCKHVRVPMGDLLGNPLLAAGMWYYQMLEKLR